MKKNVDGVDRLTAYDKTSKIPQDCTTSDAVDDVLELTIVFEPANLICGIEQVQ